METARAQRIEPVVGGEAEKARARARTITNVATAFGSSATIGLAVAAIAPELPLIGAAAAVVGLVGGFLATKLDSGQS